MIESGLQILIIGMLTVFFVLFFLIISMHMSSKIIARLVPQKNLSPAPTTKNSPIPAIAMAAISKFRQR